MHTKLVGRGTKYVNQRAKNIEWCSYAIFYYFNKILPWLNKEKEKSKGRIIRQSDNGASLEKGGSKAICLLL